MVYGPGTFLNTATEQIQKGFEQKKAELDQRAEAAAAAAVKIAKQRGYSKARQRQFADQARSLATQQFVSEALKLALRYGLTVPPALGNPEFVSQVVFDPSKGVNVPKARFAYLFPSPNSALIQVRLRPDLSDSDRDRAIDLIRSATQQPAFKLGNGQQYLVSGVPVVVQGLADEVQKSIFVLLAAALLVMAATLLVVFRTRRGMRLLPLAIALVAAAITYGCLYLVGARPHDGLDRGAAGADRPRGGLRDPVAGALRRGALGRATRPRRRRAPRPRTARPRSPGPRSPPPPASSCCCSRRCR